MEADARFTRARLAEVSGLTEGEVEACERAGLLRGDETGYRGIELVKLQLLRQVAGAQGGLFRDNVEPMIKDTIGDDPEGFAALAALAEKTVPAILEITSWLHARHLEHYVLQEVLADIEEVVGPGASRLRSAPVVAFVDLCGFTALTAGGGDQGGAAVAAGLARQGAEAPP